MQSPASLGFTEDPRNQLVILLILLEISAYPSPNDLPFTELRPRSVDYAVPILAPRKSCHSSARSQEDPRNSLQSQDLSFQYSTITDRAPSEVV